MRPLVVSPSPLIAFTCSALSPSLVRALTASQAALLRTSQAFMRSAVNLPTSPVPAANIRGYSAS